MLDDTGFEAHGGARRDVQPVAVRGVAVERQRGVGRGRWTWLPTWTGRSPVLTTSSGIRGAPSLIVTSPEPYRISPGIIGLCDRVVDGNQFCAVGESRLHLHVVQHLRNTRHNVFAAEHFAAADHQLGDRAPVAGTLAETLRRGKAKLSFEIIIF